jgi:poly-gamma-glutamate capsule biosynthesis protein CapA/YwtB (metallophosphatase superfamily)
MHRNRPRCGKVRHAQSLVLILCALLLTACLDVSLPVRLSLAAPPGSGALSNPQAAEAFGQESQEATLLAVGDIMVHTPQLPGYYETVSKQFDFSPWFTRVAPLFHEGDWVVGNLETPLAGADLKYTGYPRFNAPEQLADALYGAGVQLVSTANNHSMDRGFAGVQRTLRSVRKSGLIPFGTAESPEDAKRLVIVERGGIRMGFLAYSYGTNGLLLPSDKSFAVSLIDTKRMSSEIRRLREAGADVVTVSLHFGTEYQRLPNGEQRKIVRSAIGSGADIILGSHPHVVQPYEVVRVPASEGSLQVDRKGVAIYSLGNFISNQSDNWKDVGLIFSVHLVKTRQADGSTVTVWDRIELTPTWVHINKIKNKRYYTVLPIRQTLDDRNDPTLTPSEYARMEKMLTGIENHLRTFQN